MDLKLHAPQAACAATGRPFAAGDPLVSALVRDAGRLERRDYAAAAWPGAPEGTLAWWRSTFPAAATGATLAPADVLLDVVEELEGRDGDDDAVIRYLLVLELLRRRAVKLVDRPEDRGGGAGPAPPEPQLVVACRRRQREYVVRERLPAPVDLPGVEDRLTALFWTGGTS